MMTVQDEIYDFLRDNQNNWFNLREISAEMERNYYLIVKQVNRMMKFPDLFDGMELRYVKEFRKRGYWKVKYYRYNGKNHLQ